MHAHEPAVATIEQCQQTWLKLQNQAYAVMW